MYAIATVQLHPFADASIEDGAYMTSVEVASVTSFRRKYSVDGENSCWRVHNFIPTAILSNERCGHIEHDTVIFQISITVVDDYTLEP